MVLFITNAKREKNLRIVLSESEMEVLRENASLLGMTMSDLTRRAVGEYIARHAHSLPSPEPDQPEE